MNGLWRIPKLKEFLWSHVSSEYMGWAAWLGPFEVRYGPNSGFYALLFSCRFWHHARLVGVCWDKVPIHKPGEWDDMPF